MDAPIPAPRPEQPDGQQEEQEQEQPKAAPRPVPRRPPPARKPPRRSQSMYVEGTSHNEPEQHQPVIPLRPTLSDLVGGENEEHSRSPPAVPIRPRAFTTDNSNTRPRVSSISSYRSSTESLDYRDQSPKSRRPPVPFARSRTMSESSSPGKRRPPPPSRPRTGSFHANSPEQARHRPPPPAAPARQRSCESEELTLAEPRASALPPPPPTSRRPAPPARPSETRELPAPPPKPRSQVTEVTENGHARGLPPPPPRPRLQVVDDQEQGAAAAAGGEEEESQSESDSGTTDGSDGFVFQYRSAKSNEGRSYFYAGDTPIPMSPAIPFVVQECIRYFETNEWARQEEGLFRVSGNKGHILELDKMFREAQPVDLSEVTLAATVCGLLKLVLSRSLDPMVHPKHFKDLAAAVKLSDEEALDAIHKVIITMSPPGCVLFPAMTRLFSKIVAQPGNKMTPSNIATSVGMTVFPTMSSTNAIKVLKFFVLNVDKIWPPL